jgi:phosphopantothenate-cysteine ligase
MDPDDYFQSTPPPANLHQTSVKVKQFISDHSSKRIVLITSGGTTVPLEANTVRFLDNFSAGTRGSASAEYFLLKGYAVIFLHRQFSLEPWSRHYSTSKIFDSLALDADRLVIDQDQMLKEAVKNHKNYASRLLKVDFTTVTDYLFLLKMITQLMSVLGSSGMYYLAAAVSDFFIPNDKMLEHKIQSNNSNLILEFDQVPKMIKPLVKNWATDGLIISFKLETDPSLLLEKSRASLRKYGHSLVIGNILSTRKSKVEFITETSQTIISCQDKREIESIIVEQLITLHDQWINSKK